METIIIDFPLGGDIKVETTGYSGSACTEDVAKLLANLGSMTVTEYKPEYSDRSVTQDQRIRASR